MAGSGEIERGLFWLWIYKVAGLVLPYLPGWVFNHLVPTWDALQRQ